MRTAEAWFVPGTLLMGWLKGIRCGYQQCWWRESSSGSLYLFCLFVWLARLRWFGRTEKTCSNFGSRRHEKSWGSSIANTHRLTCSDQFTQEVSQVQPTPCQDARRCSSACFSTRQERHTLDPRKGSWTRERGPGASILPECTARPLDAFFFLGVGSA